MTQEERQLLLKDLCTRLLYGVKGTVEIEVSTGEYSIESGHLLFMEKEIDVELLGINKETEEIEVYPLNNNIDLDANIEYIDFNEEDFQENNINITNKENIDEIDKNEEEYLKNPIIQNALELGFDLVEAINALKICGENQDIVINYLYDSQN